MSDPQPLTAAAEKKATEALAVLNSAMVDLGLVRDLLDRGSIPYPKMLPTQKLANLRELLAAATALADLRDNLKEK